jgi:hypothetical protein
MGLSRNTLRVWSRQKGRPTEVSATRAPHSLREGSGLVRRCDRPVRGRRTAKALFEQIQALGYRGTLRLAAGEDPLVSGQPVDLCAS